MADLKIGAGSPPPLILPTGDATVSGASQPGTQEPAYDLDAVPTAKSDGPAAGPLAGMSLEELRKLVAKLLEGALLDGVLGAAASGNAVADEPGVPNQAPPVVASGAAQGSVAGALMAAGVDAGVANQLGTSLSSSQAEKLRQLLEQLMQALAAQQIAVGPGQTAIDVPSTPLQV